MNQHPLPFWSCSTTEMLRQLNTTKEGLIGDETGQRLARHGSNLLKTPKRTDVSAALIELVVRTRPFFKSMPGKYLLMATLFIVAMRANDSSINYQNRWYSSSCQDHGLFSADPSH